MMKYTKKGLEVSRNPSSLTGRAKPVVADRLGILDEAYIYTHIKWRDPNKQQARMARLIAGLKKRRVWKDVSRNRPCKLPHCFLIYEPTLWKNQSFGWKTVWLLGLDKQDLLVRGKPEMLAKKAKQASTGRTKCTYKLAWSLSSLSLWLVG